MPGPPYSTVTLAIPEPVTEEKIANILKELKENDVHLEEDSRNENDVVFKYVKRTPEDQKRMADLFRSWLNASEPAIKIESYRMVEEN